MWLHEYGGIDEVVFYVFCAVTVLIVILAIANVVVSCCCKVPYGSSMDFNVVVGTCLLSYTVLVRGLNVDWPTEQQLATICQFYPAALLLGLTLFMGGLMVKSWGIFLYAKYYSGKKASISEEWKPNLWIWFLIIVASAASIAWCVEFTPMLEEMKSEENNETMYECNNENGHDFEWQVATSVWHAFLLFMAAVACIANCTVSKLSETNILSLVVVNTVFAVVAAICLYFLYDDGATVNYAINGALILWFCLFANIMFLVSKVTSSRNKGTSDTRDNYDTITSTRSGDGGATNDGYLEPEEAHDFNY